MTRPYNPLRWDHAVIRGASVRPSGAELLPEFVRAVLALFVAFASGWVFAMWQQAHWIVTHTQ